MSTRRNFLRGLGGFVLAIPFLESLERTASAATATKRRFVAFTSNHGGALGADLHPPQAILTQSQNLGFQSVRRGPLASAYSSTGGVGRLSPILSAPATALPSALVAKMNVLRGLVVPFSSGHQRAGHLGNWAAANSDSAQVPFPHLPTIDQVMAYSSSFYTATPRMRAMIALNNAGSWNYQNPTARSGPIGRVSAWTSSRAMFEQFTVSSVPGRGPVVDRVLADYQRLRSNTRISAQDKERLDAHIASVDDLDKSIKDARACAATTPTDDSEHLLNDVDIGKAYRLICDVVAIAFSCDTSRIAVIPMSPYYFGARFSHYTTGSYHSDIAHQAGNVTQAKPTPPYTAREWQTQGYRRAFEEAFLYLVNKLDAISEGTGTVLDASLVTWTHESGLYTHRGYDLPVITAGSAGGAISTGNHIDYRDMARVAATNTTRAGAEAEYYGLSWHQYLGSVLKVMGIPPTDYTAGSSYGGYGQYHDAQTYYGDANTFKIALGIANTMLPFFAP